MPHYLFITLLLLVFFESDSQVTQKGLVLEQNSGKKPLSSVQIIAEGAPATASSSTGKFNLKFRAKNEGEPILFKRIEKSNYEIVNEFDIRDATISSFKELRIIMTIKGRIDKAKIKYYKISEKNINDNFNSQINALKRANIKDSIRYNIEIQKLTKEKNSALQSATELSDKFARTNKDDIDSITLKAFNIFIQGNIKGALEVLNNNYVTSNLKKTIEDEKLIKSRKEKEIESVLLKARLQVINGKIDSASTSYELVLEADSTRFEIILEYASLAYDYLRFNPAIRWLKKLLTFNIPEEAKADFLNLISKMYKELADPKSQSFYGLLSLKKKEELFHKNPIEYKIMYIVALNDFGELNNTIREYDTALVYLKKSLVLAEKTLNENVFDDNNLLAYIYRNIGNAYQGKSDYNNSEHNYNKALTILRSHFPSAYQSNIADVLGGLGALNQEFTYYDKAQRYYLESIRIQENLVKRNPLQFIDNLALEYDNFGNLYLTMEKFDSSLIYYYKSLSIRRSRFAKNAGAYIPRFALLALNIGNAHFNLKNHDSAYYYYKISESINRDLCLYSSQIYKYDLGRSLNNLAVFFHYNGVLDSALIYANECLNIREELVKKDQNLNLPDLANTYSVLGDIYCSLDNETDALKNLNESFNLRRSFLVPLPLKHVKDHLQTIFSILSIFQGQFLKNRRDEIRIEAKQLIENAEQILNTFNNIKNREIYDAHLRNAKNTFEI